MKNLIKIIEEIEAISKSSYLTSISPSLAEEEELKVVRRIILSHLTIIEREVEHLINVQIKTCKSIEQAQLYFDILQQIQELLSMLFFRDLITVSKLIKKFIRDCDRLDDQWLRNFLFEQIKLGKYSL